MSYLTPSHRPRPSICDPSHCVVCLRPLFVVLGSTTGYLRHAPRRAK